MFYATLVPHVAALLAYLSGFVVAIFLLFRSRGRAAILAAVGFGLLTLISLGQIVLALPAVSGQFFRIGQWLAWVLNCCCSIFDVAAIVCLIVALWQAVSGAGAREMAQEVVYTAEPVDVSEEVPGDVASATVKLEDMPSEFPYATRVLTESPEESVEETLEGEILEDTPEPPHVTRVLRETQEEAVEESE